MLLAFAAWLPGVRAEVPVPPLAARVTDLTGTLSAQQKSALEGRLAAFEAKKGSQIAVLIVPTTRPETIEQYSIRVAERWKLGRKGVDDGVLLLVAKDDHALRIEVGYGLEPILNDAKVGDFTKTLGQIGEARLILLAALVIADELSDSNEALLHNVVPLTWGLREVLQYAEVLLNKDDVDAKADALIDFIRERIVDRDFSDPLLGSKRYLVRSFADLEEWFRDVLSALEGKNSEGWRTHHVATIRKVRNRLSNISTRCAGVRFLASNGTMHHATRLSRAKIAGTSAG